MSIVKEGILDYASISDFHQQPSFKGLCNGILCKGVDERNRSLTQQISPAPIKGDQMLYLFLSKK